MLTRLKGRELRRLRSRLLRCVRLHERALDALERFDQAKVARIQLVAATRDRRLISAIDEELSNRYGSKRFSHY